MVRLVADYSSSCLHHDVRRVPAYLQRRMRLRRVRKRERWVRIRNRYVGAGGCVAAYIRTRVCNCVYTGDHVLVMCVQASARCVYAGRCVYAERLGVKLYHTQRVRERTPGHYYKIV